MTHAALAAQDTAQNMAQNMAQRFWEPRRAVNLSAARRHSAFIRYLRLLLILAAGTLLGVLAFYIVDGPEKPLAPQGEDFETVRMTNPRYTGLDGDGVPYTLTAEYALRALDNPDAVRLIKPVLTFLRKEGAQASLATALEGLYDSRAQSMELRTDVVVRTDDGNVCKTTHARIFAARKVVEGDEPIACTGSFGEVSGDRYEILDDYSRFIFIQNVKALLLPEPQTALDSSNGRSGAPALKDTP